MESTDSPVRAELGSSLQLNAGAGVELGDDIGTQVRGVAGVGLTAGNADVMLRYRPIVARAGEDDDDTVRPQFTSLGDYTEDADAVSSGGFVQHRLEMNAAWVAGPWTARTGALGRLRSGEGLVRTGHAHIGLDRTVGDRWMVTGTVGATAVELGSGVAFVDVYGWVGVRWGFGPR